MQSIETAQRAGACQVIHMAEFEERRAGQQERLECWLVERMAEEYGEADEFTVKNPLLRLLTKFDALSIAAQYELYGFAKKAALEGCDTLSMSREFWNFLKMKPAAWGCIEEFADRLLLREKAYMEAADTV